MLGDVEISGGVKSWSVDRGMKEYDLLKCTNGVGKHVL